MQSHGKDLKGQTTSRFARVATASIVAGSGSDNVEITSDVITISALALRPASVVFEIPVTATLTAAATCVVIGEIEKSVDNSTWVDMLASSTLLTLTGGTGGTTEKGVARMGADLIESGCEYIRFKATPNLSAAGTDTMVVGAAVAVFCGLEAT